MSLLAAFHQQCRSHPDSIACVEAQQRLSYRDLEQRARQLSRRILDQPSHCQRVIIALERGIDAAIAILAVIDAGACYIPLDLNNPPRRLNYIVEDAEPHCIIGFGARPDWLKTTARWLDIAQQETGLPVQDCVTAWATDRLAAILYTSGSTGQPKGVALSHRAMGNFADWAAATFHIGCTDHIASLAPFHFDLSVFDLFSSLSSGACIHFVPPGLTLSPSRLTDWLSRQRITVFYTVPSLLSFIALKGALQTTDLTDLKTILFAGEVFPARTLQSLCDLLPSVNFYNLYGPTETNVCCYWRVDRGRLPALNTIPIGHPASHAVLRIDSVSGELWVKCANNLSGYWQQGRLRSALTADDFYPTGDKVSINSHGEYCFHGRLDRMLKCAGHRVEPAEIEVVLQQCQDIVHCAVIGIRDATSGQRPVAAVVLKPGAELASVVNTVRKNLPTYMQPCKYQVLETMPYLANGKIDYQTLQHQLEYSE